MYIIVLFLYSCAWHLHMQMCPYTTNTRKHTHTHLSLSLTKTEEPSRRRKKAYVGAVQNEGGEDKHPHTHTRQKRVTGCPKQETGMSDSQRGGVDTQVRIKVPNVEKLTKKRNKKKKK